MKEWSLDEIAELSTDKVKALRDNCQKKRREDIVSRCNQVLTERGAIKVVRHIVELHYICPDRLNLTDLGDGTFKAGNWVLAEEHCDRAKINEAILALHVSKSEKSFFQGKIIDWMSAPPEKGPAASELHRAIFTLKPTSEALEWFGDSTGERGYKWSDD